MQKWQLALRVIGMGWYVGTAILFGALGGLWLDNSLGTRPLFIIVGLVFGIGTAFFGFIKMLTPLIEKNQHKDNR
jgi:F0F1-type ATP synthase assembly protein I